MVDKNRRRVLALAFSLCLLLPLSVGVPSIREQMVQAADWANVTPTKRVVIDACHQNWFVPGGTWDGLMVAFNNALEKVFGLQVEYCTTEITPAVLYDAKLLVLINPGLSYSTAEVDTIRQWLDFGNRGLFATCLGDYDGNPYVLNALFDALNGIDVRFNDDKIFDDEHPHPYFQMADYWTSTNYADHGSNIIDHPVRPITRHFQLYQACSLLNASYEAFDGTELGATVLAKSMASAYAIDEDGVIIYTYPSPYEYPVLVIDEEIGAEGSSRIACASGTFLWDYDCYGWAGPPSDTFSLVLNVVDWLTGQLRASPEMVASAVVRGLDWLAAQQTAQGSWYYEDQQWWASAGTTGLVVQAFMRNGYYPDTGSRYSDAVRRGLDFLLFCANTVPIFEELTYYPRDPDTNGNGIGIEFSSGSPVYETGIGIMALIATGQPDRIAVTGGPGVRGRTYREIVQDAVDYLAWAQNEPDTAGRGGWRYLPNYETSDHSVTMWPVLGLLYAEWEWGIAAPQYVKNELQLWVEFSQNLDPTDQYYGGFGYSQPGEYYNIAKTAGGICQLTYLGYPVTHERIVAARTFIDRHWWIDNLLNTYAMYAVQEAGTLTNPQITTFGAHHWYAEYEEKLMNNQTSGGYWVSQPTALSPAWGGPQINTAWALLILNPLPFTPLGFHYYGPYIDELQLVFWPNAAIQRDLIYQGNLDFMGTFFDYYPWELVDAEGVGFSTSARRTIGSIIFNCERLPWPELRRAFAYAMDKHTTTQSIWWDVGYPLDTVVPPVFGDWFNPTVNGIYFNQNLEAAMAQLESGGFIDINNDGWREDPNQQPLEIHFICPANAPQIGEPIEDLCAAMCSIGILAIVDYIPWEDYQTNIYSLPRDYDACWFGVQYDFSHRDYPDYLLTYFHSTQVANPYGNVMNFVNFTVDEQLDLIISTDSVETALSACWEVQKLLVEQVPMLPVYSNAFYRAFRSDQWESSLGGSVHVGAGGTYSNVYFDYWPLLRIREREHLGNPQGGIAQYGFLFSQNLNPCISDQSCIPLIYDSLFAVNPYTSIADIPRLATDWSSEATNTGRIYTFELAKRVRWHDGHQFNASDVAFTFTYLRDHDVSLYPVVSLISNIRTVGNNRIKITVDSYSYFDFLELVRIPILPQHIWQDVMDPYTFENDEPIGTGPFAWKSSDYGYIIGRFEESLLGTQTATANIPEEGEFLAPVDGEYLLGIDYFGGGTLPVDYTVYLTINGIPHDPIFGAIDPSDPEDPDAIFTGWFAGEFGVEDLLYVTLDAGDVVHVIVDWTDTAVDIDVFAWAPGHYLFDALQNVTLNRNTEYIYGIETQVLCKPYRSMFNRALQQLTATELNIENSYLDWAEDLDGDSVSDYCHAKALIILYSDEPVGGGHYLYEEYLHHLEDAKNLLETLNKYCGYTIGYWNTHPPNIKTFFFTIESPIIITKPVTSESSIQPSNKWVSSRYI